jgi:hypothetical protein
VKKVSWENKSRMKKWAEKVRNDKEYCADNLIKLRIYREIMKLVII